jgi:hypothetical protein
MFRGKDEVGPGESMEGLDPLGAFQPPAQLSFY